MSDHLSHCSKTPTFGRSPIPKGFSLFLFYNERHSGTTTALSQACTKKVRNGHACDNDILTDLEKMDLWTAIDLDHKPS
jgi:hypothetical protein